MAVEQEVKIFNTLTKQKEVFKPITEGSVGMYVCGPTVYGDPHLGHARGAITFDIVYRYLKYVGYKVRYVRNITDVGHLEDEVAGAGEDKIAKKARIEKIEPMEVVQYYTNRYHDALKQLNCLPPSIEPCATGHIPEQIELIEKIIENGYGYESKGSVYFDVEKYANDYKYGELSGKILDDLATASRDNLDGQDEKNGPHDFALWKNAKPEHIMKWNSPWGVGFPGWHLECTAMSSKYLGDRFDIHGGGMDLQFPHHEGEIAQSCGAFGKEPVNYWMHNNMLTLEGQKMAKSKGNFINFEEMINGSHDLLEQAYSPMTIRFFMLQAHYGSTVDFSNEALQAAEKGYKKLMEAYDIIGKMEHKEGTVDEKLQTEIEETIGQLYVHMNDDFNTAKTLASLFELSNKVFAFHNNQLDKSTIGAATFEKLQSTFTSFIAEVLGLSAENSGDDDVLSGVMDVLIKIRNQARADKDWAMSDLIRDELGKAGVVLKDGKDGTSFSVN